MFLYNNKEPEDLKKVSKFEKRFGKYAIKNISLVLIACYGIGFILYQFIPGIIPFLTLNPYEILMHGQIWRLVTWIFILPSNLSIFSLLIMMLFYYSIGTSLENTWGTYRYNVYLFSGMLFTIIGSFIAMLIVYLLNQMNIMAVANVFSEEAILFSTFYINMSIFLAYAVTFPEAQVLLMFVIPVKVKWLGIIYGVMLGLEFVAGNGGIIQKIAILASLLNFFVFWITVKNRIYMSPKQMRRRYEYKQNVQKNTKITTHKCAICGRTEEDNPTLEFRFCSKCNGNYEYCQNHLFTHEHVK